jgi:hypothetical protein
LRWRVGERLRRIVEQRTRRQTLDGQHVVAPSRP